MKIRDFLEILAKGSGIIAIALALQTVIGFVTQVVLARLLAPEIFGQLAFAATVALFFNSFTNLRGDAFVIYEKESPQNAINVAFTLELLAATFFLLLIFVASPFLMNVLGRSELTIYVQLLAFSFLYNPFSRSRSLLERELSFLQSKIPTIVAQILASVLSILLALNGYGIWSLLCWRLVILFGEVAILWLIVPYRPKLYWDTKKAKQFLGYSWPLIGSGILLFFSQNVDYFIVGQFLEDGTEQLGYYWLGFQLSTHLLKFREVLHKVLFPVFSRIDDEVFKKQAFLKLSKLTGGIFLVLTSLIVLFAHDIITVVYGNQWEPAVFPFQVIFIVVLMRAINSNNGYYLYSFGKTLPDLVSVTLFSILLTPLAYIATINFGINGTAIAVLLVQVIVSTIIYERYIRPMTGYGVLYFFFWPWLVSGLSLILALTSLQFGFPLSIKFVFLLLMLFMTYVFVLRELLHDVKTVMRILKPTGA